MQKIERLLEIMTALRDPENGCPWDQRQNFKSIAAYTLEEAYEVVDAIDREDYAELKEELGDLLLQVVYHAQMATEAGLFAFADVVDAINHKMLTRHPHVFGEKKFETETELKQHWEKQKAHERNNKRTQQSALGGVAHALPALRRAEKLQKRAAQVNFDWPSIKPVFAKIYEELREVEEAIAERDHEHLFEEVGDFLFVAVNLARHLKINAEEALRAANRKFESRFARIEAMLQTQGKKPEDCTLEELDNLWEYIKYPSPKDETVK